MKFTGRLCCALMLLFACAAAQAQIITGAPGYQLPPTVVPNKWFGTAAPTNQFPAQPGDLFFDTTNKNTYVCLAPVTSYVPITGGNTPCTSVTAGQWTLMPGSAGSSSAVGTVAQGVCHATYNFAVDGGGAPGLITPAANCTIPANSIIFNEVINWTTAGTGATNTTSIGTTGTGGGAAILQSATAVASLTGIVQGVIVPQTASGFKKITTAGTVTLTTATAALTNGLAEIWVFYLTSPE